MMKKFFEVLVIILLGVSGGLKAQDIPDKPVPPRLVNDFAGMLGSQEADMLERKLVDFNDSTTTQIAVVIVQTTDGYDIVDYADRLAERWGIGQKGLDNGILVLVRPKTATLNGEVTIRVAYGLEGVIPDLTASEIIDREILPAFRNGDFYGGLDRAAGTLMALARGEFTAEQYGHRGSGQEGDIPAFVIILIIVIIVIVAGMGKRGGGRGGRLTSANDLPFWLLMNMLGSGGRSHGGSWGSFSGGGSGGGFGGFGGGSFGGGGARGSW